MTHMDQDTLRMDCCATLSISPLDYSSPPLPYCECTVSLSLVPGDSFTLTGRSNTVRDQHGRKERVFHVNLAKAKSYGLRETSHRIGMENGQFFFLDFSDDDDYKAFLPFLRIALESLNLKDRPAPPVKPKEDYLVSPHSASNRTNTHEYSTQEVAAENAYLSLRYSKMDFKVETSKKDLSEDDKDSDNEGYEELRSPVQPGLSEQIFSSNRSERTDFQFKLTRRDRQDQSPIQTDPRGPKVPPRSQQSLRNPVYNHVLDKTWSPSPDNQKTSRNVDSPKNQDLRYLSSSSSPPSSSFSSLSSSNSENCGKVRMINTLPVQSKRQNTEQFEINYSNDNHFQSSHYQSNNKKLTRNGGVVTLPKPDRPFKNVHKDVSEMNFSHKNSDNKHFVDRACSLTPTLPTNVKIASGSNRSDSQRFLDQRTDVLVTCETKTNHLDKYETGSADDLESSFCFSVSMPLLNHRGGVRDKSKGNIFTPNNSFQRQISEPPADRSHNQSQTFDRSHNQSQTSDRSHNQSQTSLSRNVSFSILDGQKTRNINVSHDGSAVIFEMEMEMAASTGYGDVSRKGNDSLGGRTRRENVWTCSVCTLNNECLTDLCIICGASRLN